MEQFTSSLLKSVRHAMLTSLKLVLLKGLGHAILGHFSTDQMVIELTKI